MGHAPPTSHPDVVDQPLVDALVDLLDIQTLDDAAFLGQSPKTSLQRVFGGQVAGQALVAAGRTVDPERHVHSLHAYFIRPGDPSRPILYLVENVRDGRSFRVRLVVARQHGQTIQVRDGQRPAVAQGGPCVPQRDAVDRPGAERPLPAVVVVVRFKQPGRQ